MPAFTKERSRTPCEFLLHFMPSCLPMSICIHEHCFEGLVFFLCVCAYLGSVSHKNILRSFFVCRCGAKQGYFYTAKLPMKRRAAEPLSCPWFRPKVSSTWFSWYQKRQNFPYKLYLATTLAHGDHIFVTAI